MSLDRKDLIINEEILKRPEFPLSEEKMADQADEASILIQMMETRGWKLLFNKFIEPRSSKDRLLAAKSRLERDEAWGAVNELTDLMNWVKGRVDQGEKAARQLEALKNQRRI